MNGSTEIHADATDPLGAELAPRRAEGSVRPDVVEAIRAELAAGTWEDNIDMERMLDRLFADL